MLKRAFVLPVLLLLVLPCSLSGELYSTASSLTNLEEPIIISLEYIELVESLISWGYGIPIISDMVRNELLDLLEKAGIYRFKLGVNNLQYYAGTNLEKTSFGKMVESWNMIRNAIRTSREDPMKSIDELKGAVRLASDAFLEEEAYLILDARKADKMGVDNLNYSEYGGTLSEDNWAALTDTIEKMKEINRQYSVKEIAKMREFEEDEINAFWRKVTKLGIECAISESLMGSETCTSIFIRYYKKISTKIGIDDYYNALFGGTGTYTKIVEIRGKLRKAMDFMSNDWEIKKERYESLIVEKPKIDLTKSDVEDLFSVDNDPSKWIGEGEKLEEESDEKFRRASWQRNREYEDDYLYKAIQLLDEAITLKLQAKDAYETAKSIESKWKNKIDNICRKELTFESDLALKYYLEGKELCKSKDYSEKLEGAKRIRYAQKIDTNGFEKNLLLDLDKKISHLEQIIKLAKKDNINTTSAETALNSIKEKREELSELPPEQVAIEIERIYGIIKSAKEEIFIRAYQKYSILEDLRRQVLLAKDFLPEDWTYYEYMFDGYHLDVEKGLGNLLEAKNTYEELLSNLGSKGELNEEIRLLTPIAMCNKLENARFVLVVENPFPVKLVRTVKISGKTIPISLGPYEYQNITYTNKTVLAKCSVINHYSLSTGEAYEILVHPLYPLEKVYLPVTGDIVGGSKLVKSDDVGLYVENIEEDTTITVVLAGSRLKPNQNTTLPSEPEDDNTKQTEVGTITDVKMSGPELMPLYTELVGISNDKDSSTIQNNELGSSKDNKGKNSEDSIDVNRYWEMLSILKTNLNCTYVDMAYLENNPNARNFELLRDEIENLKNSAISKLNSFVVFGHEDLANKAKQLIEEERYCDVINMDIPAPEKADITGLSSMGQYNILIPLIAVLVVAYLAFSRRKPPENKIIRILKSSE